MFWLCGERAHHKWIESVPLRGDMCQESASCQGGSWVHKGVVPGLQRGCWPLGHRPGEAEHFLQAGLRVQSRSAAPTPPAPSHLNRMSWPTWVKPKLWDHPWLLSLLPVRKFCHFHSEMYPESNHFSLLPLLTLLSGLLQSSPPPLLTSPHCFILVLWLILHTTALMMLLNI